MFTFRCQRLMPLVLLGGSTLAAAGRPDPLDATVSVAPAVYESAFHNYRRLGEASPRDWKSTNDTVGRIGGWRAYAREASAPAAAPAGTPAPAAGPAHHGHGQPPRAKP